MSIPYLIRETNQASLIVNDFVFVADILSMCADLEPSSSEKGSTLQEIALSLLTVEGYDGQNCCISLHACLALTPICRN